MKLSVFFITAIPLASAWHLQLYRDELYKNVIEDRDGSLGQPCKDLTGSKGNKISSMHWKANGAIRTCEIVLYNWSGCREAGGILGRSRGDWNLPNFSSQAN
ncbi:hypothetical protein BT63DRAFT_422381, partial [Microthyrium microscopicum]